MTLYADIVSVGEPTKEVVRKAFKGNPEAHGKKMKSFSADLNHRATGNDLYTSHFNLNADHYDVYAEFE